MDDSEALEGLGSPVAAEVTKAKLPELSAAPDKEAPLAVNSSRVITPCRNRNDVLPPQVRDGRKLPAELSVVVAELPIVVVACCADLETAVDFNEAESVRVAPGDLNNSARGALGEALGHVDLGGSPAVAEVPEAKAAAAVPAKDQEVATNCESHAVLGASRDGSDSVRRLELLGVKVSDHLGLRGSNDATKDSHVGSSLHPLVSELPVLA